MVVISAMLNLLFNTVIKTMCYYYHKLIFKCLDSSVLVMNSFCNSIFFIDLKTLLLKGVHGLSQMVKGVYGIIKRRKSENILP